MRPTVCLNMIVKNEARVIRRCLDSLRPFIDTWVIVDTGSTDGTQALIQDCLSDIPGELYERPWKNFAHNRTGAIRLAEGKVDYLLLCDADMTLVVHDPGWRERLVADAYLVKQRDASGLCYSNIRLLNARLTGDRRWRYWCSTHEFVDSVRPGTPFIKSATDAIEFRDHADGGSKADKLPRDAALLEAEMREIERLQRQAAENPERADLREALLEQQPLLPRIVFYLAQTYRGMRRLRKSLKMYERRASLGGWAEEVWFSLYEIAKVSEQLGLKPKTVIDRYLQAYQYRPQRAEPLVELARFCRERKHYALAHLFAERAQKIAKPNDILFLDSSCYDWRALDEYAIASYWVGNYRESAQACEELLNIAAVPSQQIARVTENLNFALKALGRDGRTADLSTNFTSRGLPSLPDVPAGLRAKLQTANVAASARLPGLSTGLHGRPKD